MKSYTLATKTPDGAIVRLDIPPMSIAKAERHAANLRAMAPGVPVYVVNINTPMED